MFESWYTMYFHYIVKQGISAVPGAWCKLDFCHMTKWIKLTTWIKLILWELYSESKNEILKFMVQQAIFRLLKL